MVSLSCCCVRPSNLRAGSSITGFNMGSGNSILDHCLPLCPPVSLGSNNPPGIGSMFLSKRTVSPVRITRSPAICLTSLLVMAITFVSWPFDTTLIPAAFNELTNFSYTKGTLGSVGVCPCMNCVQYSSFFWPLIRLASRIVSVAPCDNKALTSNMDTRLDPDAPPLAGASSSE